MTTFIYLLSLVGLTAICIGTASLAFKCLDDIERRKRDTEKHRSAVLDSLKRIETNIAKSNPAAR